MGRNYRLKKLWFRKGYKLQKRYSMNIGAAYPHGSYSEWWQLVTRVDNIFAIRRTEFKNDFVNKYRRNREREINQARFEEICKGLGVAVHDLY